MRAILILLLLCGPVMARDNGQWENGDPAVTAWYRELMMPDVPTASCCGEADAYWCDEIHVRDQKTYCNITDTREIPFRTPVPLGTEIEIPDYKLKWDRGNPTGHAIVFLSTAGYVYCFVQGGGT